MTWKILTGYELLHKWILGISPFDASVELLFWQIEEAKGAIQLCATPETIERIFWEFSQEFQNSNAINARAALKVSQFRQHFDLASGYQPEARLAETVDEKDLYLTEIQYASQQDISLVCYNPSGYEQLLDLGNLQIKILQVSDFLQMCEEYLVAKASEATGVSQAIPVEAILPTDSAEETPASEPTQDSPGAETQEFAKEQARQFEMVRRGWLWPTSHRIVVPTDFVQMLLLLLGPVVLTYLLQNQGDDRRQSQSPNRIELALGADELDKILQLPWQMLLDRSLQFKRSESTASRDTTPDQSAASTVVTQPDVATTVQILNHSQPPSQPELWQSNGVDFHVKQTLRGADLLKLQLRNRDRAEQDNLNIKGVIGGNLLLNLVQNRTRLPKDIQQPVDFVPELLPSFPQLDPLEGDSPIPDPFQPITPEPPDPRFNQPQPVEPAEFYDFIPEQIPNPVFPVFPGLFDRLPETILPPSDPFWNPPLAITPVNSDGSPDVDDVNDGAEVSLDGMPAPKNPDLVPDDKAFDPSNPIPVDPIPDSDDLDQPDLKRPTDRPSDESNNPNNPTTPEAEDSVSDPVSDPTDKPGDGEDQPALPGEQWIRLNNPLGNDQFWIEPGRQYIIENFGGVGQGTAPPPSVIALVDTLKFRGEGLTAENMLLTQQGADLVMQFEAANSPKIIFKNFELDLLDNLTVETFATVTIGNMIFDGQEAIEDAFDVVNAEWDIQQVLRPNTVTFLNRLNNVTTGYVAVENSNDVINGLAGDDALSGLDGDDLLRGGEGDDRLDGGAGDDILNGGAGNDVIQDFAGNNQMIGGGGRDRFILQPGSGWTVIRDFQPGEDRVQLTHSGAIASQIKGQDTVLLFNNQPFAILQNVQTDLWGALGRSE